MKIKHLQAWSVSMGLREPYVIAYETIDRVHNVFLRAETDEGLIGYGCAAPDPELTGETVDSVLAQVDKVVQPLLQGADPLRRVKILEQLSKLRSDAPSVVAAVDMVLHDLLGKVAGLPLWQLLGGFRHRMRTSITIGILDERETVERAREHVRAGFRFLKLKGGLDPRQDAERVLAVHDAVGNKVKIRFDANQGFSVADCREFVERTRVAKLEILEQPTPRDEPELLGLVTHAVSLPVMADESITGLRSAFRLARKGLMDMVNIKLMKVGGIREAIAINAVARSAGLEAMVGCTDESALGIAAGLHFALASPNVEYADLDGHLDLIDDPTAGTVTLRDGYLIPGAGAGLGLVGDLKP